MGKKNILLVILILCWLNSWSQVTDPVQWSFIVSESTVQPGDEIELFFKIDLEPNWYIYSNDFEVDIGPIPTKISFDAHKSYQLIGKTRPLNVKEKYDDIWGITFRYMDEKAGFKQKVKILDDNPIIKGYYICLVCSMVDGKCISKKERFMFPKLGTSPIQQQNLNERKSVN